MTSRAPGDLVFFDDGGEDIRIGVDRSGHLGEIEARTLGRPRQVAALMPVIGIPAPDRAAGFGEERKAPSPLRRCDPQVRQAMAGGPLDWRLSRDGMTIELPAGSSEIKFGED
jgi:hypothetical protein